MNKFNFTLIASPNHRHLPRRHHNTNEHQTNSRISTRQLSLTTLPAVVHTVAVLQPPTAVQQSLQSVTEDTVTVMQPHTATLQPIQPVTEETPPRVLQENHPITPQALHQTEHDDGGLFPADPICSVCIGRDGWKNHVAVLLTADKSGSGLWVRGCPMCGNRYSQEPVSSKKQSAPIQDQANTKKTSSSLWKSKRSQGHRFRCNNP